MVNKVKIVVLFSGNGSNLENLIKHFHCKRFGDKETQIIPITNRPNAKGIERAKKYGINTTIIDHKEFESRESFDAELVKVIKSIEPSLVVAAGFMRILTPVFTEQIRAINLHPSLLPLFKGANAIEESFNSQMRVGGVTVHWITPELDGGEIVEQGCVKKIRGETLEEFRQRIHDLEYTILPASIKYILNL
ncbi:phosphoribosylglycinamide formyltransferase [Hydrogenimonas thermophila]|uniref:Phosphoribosylglycinamide formyltransferase n=1 Tax=Hydrogenimonas thermophila TaxID=223786 RepID=A0A1I5T5L1_9BACT|nr:phosphoribosylglycinamide formyltransferase [Hydrogenimonas thermophila]SFP78111.1 formyltetrahydrofolate-dependent phosphoribosylglycinamide formyltransferase [Hydrogenimonas thermophila]